MTTREAYLKDYYFGRRWGWGAARGVFAIIFGLIALKGRAGIRER